MKQVRIETIDLKNFKGLTATYQLDGDSHRFSGWHATGKSRIGDAIMFTLDGADQKGEQNPEQFKNNDAEPGERPARVTLTITINGKEHTLLREIRERTHDADGHRVVTGHSTYFELNGTKVTKRDYDDFIADEIGTPADIRKAMQLWGIVHLSPGELRQEILSIAGDVTLQQVADAHPDVAPALELVEDGDLTKTRKNLDREIRAISPQKTELQNRIDENQHALDTLDKPENIVDLEQAVTKAEASETEARATLEALERGDNTDARNKIAALEREIHELRDAQTSRRKQAVAAERHDLEQEASEAQEAADEKQKAARAAETTLADDQRDERRMAMEIKDIEQHVATLKKGVETALKNRDDLREQWAEVSNEPVTVTARDVTPNEAALIQAALDLVVELDELDQSDLPDTAWKAVDALVATCDATKYGMSAEEAQQAAEAAKQKKLDDLAKTGQDANEAVETRQKDLDAAAANLEVLQQDHETMTGQVALSQTAVDQARAAEQEATKAATAARDALANLAMPPEDPTEWEHLTRQIEELKQAIDAPAENLDAIRAQYDEAKQAATAARAALADAKALANVATSTENRIEQLRNQFQAVVENHERLLRNRDLLDKLARKQVEMLDENLANTFKVAKFQLLRINFEGNLEEVCRIYTQDGVPFTATNEAEQAEIALDIALAKQRAIEVNAPIIVDRRESYLSLPMHLDGHQFVTMQVTDTQGAPLTVEKVEK